MYIKMTDLDSTDILFHQCWQILQLRQDRSLQNQMRGNMYPLCRGRWHLDLGQHIPQYQLSYPLYLTPLLRLAQCQKSLPLLYQFLLRLAQYQKPLPLLYQFLLQLAQCQKFPYQL